MPTLRSYWEGRDIELRRRLNLYPERRDRRRSRSESASTTGNCCWRLCGNRASIPRSRRRRPSPFTAELAHALHLYLARSSTALVALQIEDLLGMTDRSTCPEPTGNIRTGSARSRQISRIWRRARIWQRSSPRFARRGTSGVRRHDARLLPRPPRSTRQPPIKTATGTILTACAREDASDKCADEQGREHVAEQMDGKYTERDGRRPLGGDDEIDDGRVDRTGRQEQAELRCHHPGDVQRRATSWSAPTRRRAPRSRSRAQIATDRPAANSWRNNRPASRRRKCRRIR